jgi:hypothetical protein
VKTLYVFDFDDTLAWTDSHVRVFRGGRLHRTLKPHEYAKYQKQPGDEVDYSDFANLIDPEVIELTMDTMLGAYERGDRVMILTARGPSAKRDIHTFLADNGIEIPMEDIVTLNDSNPAAKGEFVARVVAGEEFDSVEFFDDSEANVQAVYDMVGEASPETMVAAHHVVHEKPGVRGSEVLFRKLIREMLLREAKSAMNLVPHSEVVAAIDNALRDERLNIDIPGFRDLMIEIAIVESGMVDGGKLHHNNEMGGDIKGVFQISPIALQQLREPTAVPRTKERLGASKAMSKGWEKQSDSEIFSSLKMQALAACMYALWIYYNLAGEPNLTSRSARASFWDQHYNTKSDVAGTVALFHDRVRELEQKA